MSAWQLLPAIRGLYSRRPECFYREPRELQHVFFSLGYVDDVDDLAAAVEVARSDWPQWRAA
jgi:hypothetical protein